MRLLFLPGFGCLRARALIGNPSHATDMEIEAQLGRETGKPRSPPHLRRARHGDVWSFRAVRMSLLRSNDLIWANVVNNYLLGQKPPAFDLLYWNSDGTRMARAAHGWYLRNTYVENNLVQPGKVHLKGEALDLGRIHQDSAKTPSNALG
jgi:hypothetical protein